MLSESAWSLATGRMKSKHPYREVRPDLLARCRDSSTPPLLAKRSTVSAQTGIECGLLLEFYVDISRLLEDTEH